MTYKFEDIDDLYFALTRLTTHEYEDDNTVNAKCLNSATGFFYHNNSNNRYFLITSRHVVIDETKGHHPNVIRLYLHTDANDLTKNDEFDINLYQGTKRQWLEADIPNYDVIAIPIPNDFAQKAIVTGFADEFFLPEGYKLSLGHQVMIIGYPLGYWFDEVHNFPTIRSGIVSSVYPMPYNNYPYFLVDARLHEGTSGSPVITAGRTRAYKKTEVIKPKEKWGRTDEEKELDKIQSSRYLLGINSRTFPFPENQKTPDLNAVYFSQILKKFTG